MTDIALASTPALSAPEPALAAAPATAGQPDVAFSAVLARSQTASASRLPGQDSAPDDTRPARATAPDETGPIVPMGGQQAAEPEGLGLPLLAAFARADADRAARGEPDPSEGGPAAASAVSAEIAPLASPHAAANAIPGVEARAIEASSDSLQQGAGTALRTRNPGSWHSALTTSHAVQETFRARSRDAHFRPAAPGEPASTDSAAFVPQIPTVHSTPVADPVQQPIGAPDPNPSASPSLPPPAGESGAPRPAAPVRTRVEGFIGTPLWTERFVSSIVRSAREGLDIAEIRIEPPELGPVGIRLSVAPDATTPVTVHFVSAHAAVRDAIEAALPRLREMMAEAGLTLGEATVGPGNPWGEAHGRGSSPWNEPNPRTGFDTRPAALVAEALPAPRAYNVLIDTFA